MQPGQLVAWPCLLAGLTATASPIAEDIKTIAARATIDHDKVQVIPELLPPGNLGLNLKKFQPYFNTEGPGCWPYPAVDIDGNTSGGLKPTGSSGGGCTDSVGQVYVRAAKYAGYWAAMYTWYMPKDLPVLGEGHRNDWEDCVLWFDDLNLPNPKLVGASVSKHGEYAVTTVPDKVITYHEGHPLVKYYSDWGIFGTHDLDFTDKVGGLQPAVNFDMLPLVVQNALQNTDWGKADFPMGWAFAHELGEAYPWR
ncbi:hypothetical protein E4U53_003701 [Claviceps sorghi]|nr:hypothetical protein E4U53_003701 [Claviceps sorghi]